MKERAEPGSAVGALGHRPGQPTRHCGGVVDVVLEPGGGDTNGQVCSDYAGQSQRALFEQQGHLAGPLGAGGRARGWRGGIRRCRLGRRGDPGSGLGRGHERGGRLHDRAPRAERVEGPRLPAGVGRGWLVGVDTALRQCRNEAGLGQLDQIRAWLTHRATRRPV